MIWEHGSERFFTMDSGRLGEAAVFRGFPLSSSERGPREEAFSHAPLGLRAEGAGRTSVAEDLILNDRSELIIMRGSSGQLSCWQ